MKKKAATAFAAVMMTMAVQGAGAAKCILASDLRQSGHPFVNLIEDPYMGGPYRRWLEIIQCPGDPYLASEAEIEKGKERARRLESQPRAEPYDIAEAYP